MTWYKRNEALPAEFGNVRGVRNRRSVGCGAGRRFEVIEIGKVMSIGYELEEGMHGPTLSFHSHLCVLV